MALKSLAVHYTKIINDDRVPIDFDIVRKEDREMKCIACYINGFYLKNNLDFLEITQKWLKCVQDPKQEEIQRLLERGVHRTV